jgi:hypothetical protein
LDAEATQWGDHIASARPSCRAQGVTTKSDGMWDLLAEALNMLFQSRHLPMIAAPSREQAAVFTSRKPPASAPGDNE